jgi:hypothetical protein
METGKKMNIFGLGAADAIPKGQRAGGAGVQRRQQNRPRVLFQDHKALGLHDEGVFLDLSVADLENFFPLGGNTDAGFFLGRVDGDVEVSSLKDEGEFLCLGVDYFKRAVGVKVRVFVADPGKGLYGAKK